MNLMVAALRDIQSSKTTLTAQISIPLSPGVNLSSNYQNFNSGDANRGGNLTTVLQKNLPAGEGYGYQLRSNNQSGDQADFHIQKNVGTYSIGASDNNGNTATRLQASGGMAYLGNEFYFSRRINQSFAVAHVADYSDIHVLTDNQPAGQTDAKGNVFLPRLRAYDKNIISLDPTDIPFDAQIESTSITVTPYFRSGVEISFPIIRTKNATLQLVLSDGTKIPSGTAIKLEGSENTFTVGLDGELYLSGLNANNKLTAILPTHICHIDFEFKSTSDPVPFLGSFVCIDEQP
jgi:outer membrane usher protein